MHRLFQRFARSIGLAHDPNIPSGSAERPLRALLVASIVLPILLFAIVAAISYRQHFIGARDRLERDLGRITEHALKVFETFELSAIYLDELIAGLTDEQIRNNEREYSARLSTITKTMPQLRDLWVIDPNGFPVVPAPSSRCRASTCRTASTSASTRTRR